jgi:micrococcal nuclease
VVVLMGMVLAIPAQVYPAMPPGVQGPFTVIKVVDEDTIWVDNGGPMKIRMIGVDTPESVDPRKPVQCFALEASAQAKTILGGQSVYLETDPSQDTYDKYGRTLAYVWTTSGRLFNLDMITDGFAYEYTYDLPYHYQADFKAAQNDARAPKPAVAVTCAAPCDRREVVEFVGGSEQLGGDPAKVGGVEFLLTVAEHRDMP